MTLDEIVVADPPEAWAAAGFTVDPDGVTRIGHVRVRLVGRDAGKRLRSGSLRDAGPIPPDGVDGLPTTASAAAPCEPAVHPNGTTGLDHLVLLTPDVARTVAALGAIGLEPRRTRHTDQYGMPASQTFFRAGEVIVELIGPDEPAGDGPAGFFGLAFTVDDLDALAERLGPALGPAKDAVQPGRRIATLRHKEVGISVAIAFMTPEPTTA